MDTTSSNVRTWTVLCHASALLGVFFHFLGHIFGPLIVWLMKRGDSPEIDAHGKESLNFQLSMLIYDVSRRDSLRHPDWNSDPDFAVGRQHRARDCCFAQSERRKILSLSVHVRFLGAETAAAFRLAITTRRHPERSEDLRVTLCVVICRRVE